MFPGKTEIGNNYYILTKYLHKFQYIVKLVYMILNWGNWIYAAVR